jgi:hypothetical protein
MANPENRIKIDNVGDVKELRVSKIRGFLNRILQDGKEHTRIDIATNNLVPIDIAVQSVSPMTLADWHRRGILEAPSVQSSLDESVVEEE